MNCYKDHHQKYNVHVHYNFSDFSGTLKRNFVNLCPIFWPYLTAPSSESSSPRGLHTHEAFNTRAGVHSRSMRRDKCIAENMHALTHAMVVRTAKNTLTTCSP